MFDQVWQNIIALSLILMTLVFIGAFFVYFAPSFIAAARHKKQFNAIFCLNLFAGWTLLGWVGALVWAVFKEDSDSSLE